MTGPVTGVALDDAPRPSVFDAAIAVLMEPAPERKAALSRDAAAQWRAGRLTLAPPQNPPPDRPGRPVAPELRPPKEMPRRRLGSAQGRAALLHAIAHIEFNAIDLAWDMTARFAMDAPEADRADFVSDWTSVADDEARHFELVRARLKELGADYGDFPAHDGLWKAALDTRDSLLARLAVAPLVLEARGLDVTPNMIAALERAGDAASAAALRIIYDEEVGHVAIGLKWFEKLCVLAGKSSAVEFRRLVAERFAGGLKPPFNDEARRRAGLLPEFYMTPLMLPIHDGG